MFQFIHIFISTCYFHFLLIVAILIGVRWYLIVLLIYIYYLIISDGNLFFFLFKFFSIFFFFFTTPATCGSSPARSRIWATATGLHQTTATPDWATTVDLHCNSWQHLNPLSRVSDWTHVLIDTNRVHYRWATTGILVIIFSYSCWSFVHYLWILHINRVVSFWLLL